MNAKSTTLRAKTAGLGSAARIEFRAAKAPTFFCLIAVALLAALAGCRKSSSPAFGAEQVLRISQRNEPTDLDPATASLPDEFFVIRALSEGLLVPNPAGGEPIPAAAERYELSPDGLTYTFHLRPGATWSNGEPVTADDFVASYRRVLDPATGAPKAHLFYAVKNAQAYVSGEIHDFAAVGIRATDPRTLVVTLARPVANFPLYVASGPWIPVNPRVVARSGSSWTQPANYVGNGPFALVEWRPQQRIVARKSFSYRDAVHVQLREIQFIRFDSADTEERSYRAGEIDVTMAVPQTKLATYAADRSTELHRAPLAETRFIAFNTTRPPLNDVRVRRALALAIDRERIVRDVLRGGQLPATQFLSPALVSFDPANARSRRHAQAYDPVEARRLLAEAGFPGGRGFPRLELAGWDRNPVLEAIQQMWRRELGLDVHLLVQEAKVHLAALNSGNFDLAFATNLLDVRDPIAALGDFTTDAPNNFSHWHSADYDQWVEKARGEQNSTAAANEISAAEALLIDSAAIAPVYFNVQNWLMTPRVHGWEQDALWSRRYNEVNLEQP